MKWNLELILWKVGSTVIATHAMAGRKRVDDNRIGEVTTILNVFGKMICSGEAYVFQIELILCLCVLWIGFENTNIPSVIRMQHSTLEVEAGGGRHTDIYTYPIIEHQAMGIPSIQI